MYLPEHFASDLVATFAFAVVAIITLLIGYKIFDMMTPKCNFQEELAKGNVAVAVAMAGYFIAIAAIVASVAHAIIG
jgi:putative membrane protein